MTLGRSAPSPVRELSTPVLLERAAAMHGHNRGKLRHSLRSLRHPIGGELRTENNQRGYGVLPKIEFARTIVGIAIVRFWLLYAPHDFNHSR